MATQGRITAIQRMSVHDGPGIRTTVFLKGCDLRCPWCHNPETWSGMFQLQFIAEKCIGCGKCMEVCRQAAWNLKDGIADIDRNLCSNHGECVEVCYTGAITRIGTDTTPDEVINVIMQDLPYYKESGGGVTLSGGEPLLQPNFANELLEKCNEKGIHTAIESNLNCTWEIIEKMLPVVNLWICDLKMVNREAHKYWTGCDNSRIIANLSGLNALKIPLIIRTPVIPGVNDTAEDINSICDVVSEFKNIIMYELVPFHPLGNTKLQSLGMQNHSPSDKFLQKQLLKEFYKIPERKGIRIPLDVDNH